MSRYKKIIDVSLLKGDAALESINDGLVECTCDDFNICQACSEVNDGIDSIDSSIEGYEKERDKKSDES